MNRRVVSKISILILFFSLPFESIEASMVARMSFGQVVKGAELIIEGQVVSKEIRSSPINGRPFSYFQIEIIDVIKGEYPDSAIEIGYMGGRIGEMTLTVSNMRMPEIGERGIYFVETLSQQQVHPLIGWQQGHYRVILDTQTGQEAVVSDEDRQEARSRAALLQQSTDLEGFKQSIRSIMEKDQ